MSVMASQITGLTIVYSTVYSGADQRIHESSASLAFCGEDASSWGILAHAIVLVSLNIQVSAPDGKELKYTNCLWK